MLWTSEISAKVKEVFFQFKNQTGINEETIWRTAFQSYLYRTTFQSKIIVASADQKTGKWVAYVQEFSRDTRFVDQIDRDFSTASGDFPIQAAFYYGVEKKTKNINSNICLVVMLDKLILEFDSKFYSEGEVERISSGFIVFLENLADNFEQIIAKIPLLSPEQLHLQTVIWNKTELDYEKESTLPKIFEEMVQKHPTEVAAIFGKVSITYHELNIRSDQVAKKLIEKGLLKGGFVGLFLQRDLDLIVSMIGVLKAGGVFIPLDPRYPADALKRILANVDLKMLLTKSFLKEKFPARVDNEVIYDHVGFEVNSQISLPKIEISSDDTAFVLFTSGSTGTPKGVVHTHRNIISRFTAIQDFLSMGIGGVFSQSSPISSIDAIDELLMPLMHGAATAVIPYEEVIDPELLLGALNSMHVTHILLVPSLLKVILNKVDEGKWSLNTLKACIVGGEALTRELAEKFLDLLPNAKLYNFYGLTEGDVSRIEVDRKQILDSPSSIGRPVANTKVYLLDEFDNLVPINTPGEICVSSEGLFLEYLNRPDLNEKVFIDNPFINSSKSQYSKIFRTGDFGMYLATGTLEYLGRRDRMVKVRGFRVELDEIEDVLKKYPGIKECLVVAKDIGEKNSGTLTKQKKLVAYFLPEEGVTVSIREIQKYLAEHLADFSIPQAIMQIDQFPLSPNGKIDVKALPNPAEIIRQNAEDYISPRNSAEKKLVEIWENLLQIKPIGVNENFFDLGGDSLSAIDLMISIEKAFNRSHPISILLQNPTIETLVKVIESDQITMAGECLVPIQTSGSLPPLFCIHADGGVMFYYEFARRMDNQPIYGIQARGLSAGGRPHSSVEEMAKDYLSEIKSIQPQGPYHFCAFSLGGVVVLEMARQLHENGEVAAFVGLLDAYAPGYPELLPEKGLIQYKLSVHMGTMRLHGWKGRISYLYRRLRTRIQKIFTGIFGGFLISLKIPLPQSVRYYYVANVLNNIVDQHQSKEYSGTVTLFRASIQPENIVPDPELGWGKYVSGGIKVIEVPGTHNSIIKDPHLTVLVNAIRTELPST